MPIRVFFLNGERQVLSQRRRDGLEEGRMTFSCFQCSKILLTRKSEGFLKKERLQGTVTLYVNCVLYHPQH